MIETFLFKLVNGTSTLDLTNFIVVPTYKVNNKSVYEEWTDGNLITHRDEMRKRVEGSFTLMFTNISDLENFLDFYNDVMNSSSRIDCGSIHAYVYMNNEHNYALKEIYMEFELTDDMPFYGVKELDGIEVTIKER